MKNWEKSREYDGKLVSIFSEKNIGTGVLLNIEFSERQFKLNITELKVQYVTYYKSCNLCEIIDQFQRAHPLEVLVSQDKWSFSNDPFLNRLVIMKRYLFILNTLISTVYDIFCKFSFVYGFRRVWLL